MKVGFIGLGLMGAGMALNLRKAGHELFVNDVKRELGKRHVAQGCVWMESLAELAQASDVVFTSLPGPKEVEAVALGGDGLLLNMRAGTTWFDLTTSSPTLVRKLHEMFAAKGIAVLDAPVSGGPKGADSGKLALLVGGDEALFNQHKPLLDAMGDQPIYMGQIGTGSVAKLVHNSAGYTIQTVLAEVFTMGVKGGVEPLALWKALRQTAQGRVRTFDRLAAQFLPGEFDKPTFLLRGALKDMTLATDLARELHVPMRMAALAHAEFTEGVNRGWGDLDSRAPMMLQEERAGVNIKVPRALVEAALKDG
jgi:3-hydroxyisobutyrate dehydrogenase